MEDGREGLSHPWPVTSALELEDLLDELRTRASLAHSSQEQLAALLDAVLAISADLELNEVLGRIVAAACHLVDARYGALGVIGADGQVVEFITRGISEEARAAIGDPPAGFGVLGLLMSDPRPQRLRDVRSHPLSTGFPANHPEFKSFLGVPVRIRDVVFGNLYLGDKLGADEFSAADEAMLVALAAAAGIAIDHARLYDRAQQQAAWSTVLSHFSQALLASGPDDSVALGGLTQDVRALAAASACALLLVEAGGAWLAAAEPALQLQALGPSELATAAAAGYGATGVDLAFGPVRDQARTLLGVVGEGPVVMVPLGVGEERLAVLLIAWDEGAGPADDLMAALDEFGRQASLTLAAARGRRDRSRMELLEDRERIARDMHDHVIQRLFATGLSLQSAARLAVHPVVQERLEEAVDDLDIAIKDIRHAIFELHKTTSASGGDAGHEIRDLVYSYSEHLGFEPRMMIEGRIASIEGPLLGDVLAVLREAMSNVVKHAQATAVDVRVAVSGHVTVEVADNGIGVSSDCVRSGLKNLAERADQRGGALDISPGEKAGTLLTWRVPRTAR